MVSHYTQQPNPPLPAPPPPRPAPSLSPSVDGVAFVSRHTTRTTQAHPRRLKGRTRASTSTDKGESGLEALATFPSVAQRCDKAGIEALNRCRGKGSKGDSETFPNTAPGEQCVLRRVRGRGECWKGLSAALEWWRREWRATEEEEEELQEEGGDGQCV